MISLVYHGYACWTLEGSPRIVIDPGSLFGKGPAVQEVQVVCITHSDPDHMNALSRLKPVAPALLLAPRPLDPRWDFRSGKVQVGEWTITPVSLPHRFRPWVPHRGYLFEAQGKRILHLGDGNELSSAGPVDALMVTIGGVLANPRTAARMVRQVKPRRVFPMHYYFQWQADWFKRLIPEAEIVPVGGRVVLE